jgi:hypothetical protein
MAECICGDDESEHDNPVFGLPRRCRNRVLLAPPTTLLPEGRYEDCDCPGYEPAEDDEEETM